MTEKRRLDQLLVERGLAPSRTQAQAMIIAGEVIVGEQRQDKPGTRIDITAPLRLRPRRQRYVSRAGAKLVHALDHFEIDVGGLCALDAGASTGGFTEVLLERGARRVYAIDVGYGQMDSKLSRDARVIVLDRVNVRSLTPAQVPEPVEVMTLDLSFISLTKVLQPLLPFIASGGLLICLVKPQFEAGRGRVGKGGIVTDQAVRLETLVTVRAHAQAIGLETIGHVDSPVPGQKGNVEFLLALARR